MKREYFEPQIKIFMDMEAELLAGSLGGSVTGGGDVEIDYGGVDTGGNKDPEAKPCTIYDAWEEKKPNLIYDVWKDEQE